MVPTNVPNFLTCGEDVKQSKLANIFLQFRKDCGVELTFKSRCAGLANIVVCILALGAVFRVQQSCHFAPEAYDSTFIYV